MRKTYGSALGLRLPVGTPLVMAGDRAFMSGLISDRPGELESEAHRVFQQAAELLREAGISSSDVVRTRVFYVEDAGAARSGNTETLLRDVHGVVFDHPGPAFTAIRVSCLPAGAFVEIELEAVRGAGKTMRRTGSVEKFSTSEGVRWGDEVWLSGMRSFGPEGDVITPGSAFSQSAIAAVNAETVLKSLGAGVPDVVASRYWVRHDAQDQSRAPELTEFMRRAIPTSAGIAVEGVGPDGAVFMFEVDAVVGAASGRNNLRSGRTFEIINNYCRSVRVGTRDVVYVAGSTSLVPGEIIRHPGQVAAQVRDALETVRWSVEAQGLAWSHLARTRTYIVGGPEKLDEAKAALREAIGNMPAAASLVGVPALGRPGVVVEIEAIAVKG